jgi:hypothetical protein
MAFPFAGPKMYIVIIIFQNIRTILFLMELTTVHIDNTNFDGFSSQQQNKRRDLKK